MSATQPEIDQPGDACDGIDIDKSSIATKTHNLFNSELMSMENLFICLLSVSIGYYCYFKPTQLITGMLYYVLLFALGVIGIQKKRRLCVIGFEIGQFVGTIALVFYLHECIWLYLDPPALRATKTAADKQMDSIIGSAAVMIPALIGFSFVYVIDKYRTSLN
eukprot:161993_1